MNTRRTSAQAVAETTVTQGEESLKVQLTSPDSERLSKAFTKVSTQPADSPDSRSAEKVFTSQGDDLQIRCDAGSSQSVSKDCTLTMKVAPETKENFLQSDADAGEHMFHLRTLVDVKRLYSSLNVKEWDLQGSTYKRFATADNKLILECILDDARSRCSVFLSNGQSDDYSD